MNKFQKISHYRQMVVATPKWVDVDSPIHVYREAQELRGYGLKVEVDHVVPLRHPEVCGLHCPDNLRIVHAEFNRRKSNYTWPGMWRQQAGLWSLN